ncbi:YSIRK-type signal peptide-containing protein [Limosilactobacillus reuteri]|uniref:YSIRK-type signal peptide-containing protein n=1 Tax=Limosilactobacillus reuteri TaxID=1598 RepID=UPI001E2CFDBF|nr:PT domain-containing protein [Limosilactobacillus reuteri]MCC4356070.1 PT domain-containing protein [Limosilactobacillus reuteri]
MSKNNAQEYVRKMEPQRQRFGLRKLSVGVASVLLGTTFMVGGSTVAHADSTPTPTVVASSTSDHDQRVANENEKATTSESASTNTANQNDSQTSGSQQSVITNQLKESKVVTPAKQVSAILNIYDYDDVDPQTPKAQNGNDVAFTYTGKFTDGLSIKDAIQAQIDADTQKQLAYKDQGTAIIPDKDGLPTEIGVSPVISAPFSDNDLGGYFFRDKTTTTYQQNNQTQLVDAYNKWLDYKQAHFALAGYKLVDQDEQAINLDDPIEDGKTYNIYVNHQLSVVNVYHWTELKRTVEFKYYYKQDDKNAQAADSVTKNGYYNDGKYNQTQPEQFINTAGKPVFSNLPKKDSNVNQTDISDANSFETRLLPDDLKTTKDQTKVLHDTINSRYIDLAVGLITDSQGNLNNYGKASMIYPSGTILFEGEPVKQIDNWHTFDPNVPDTGSDDINDTNTYSTVQGGFNKGTGYVVEPVNNPATTTIYYYHDQPVDITFEDVTNGDANAPVLSNFTASKDLRVDLNSQYIPGKPHTTPKDKKNNKNQKYEAYSYQADDNTYSTNAINVDPSGTLKSSKSLNYADVLKAYTDNGYVLISSDPDDLTYEVEDVYDNNRNLQHKKRVVKLVHRAIAHTDSKTATRTIHYVANTKDGKQLQDDTTQNVTLTSSTYYTDAVTGNRVNAKQDTNGDWIVDTENAAALPAITWTVNADKSTGLTTDDKNFAAITTPETITLDEGEAAKRDTDEGDWYLVSTDKNGEVSYGDPNSDTWNADTPNKIADGYLVYKQKAQYNIHYIDVNGVEGKTTYEPTDGKELKDHQVTGVGSEDKTYVGDTPDATAKLWSPADYEKAGYVLVGLSDNAKGDLLGKQTLTKGVQDQYVYLKHAVKTITPNTPVEDVPKDPDGKRAIDPSDLHKEFTRTITFVANNDAKSPLKDAVPQKVEFDGHIYVDMVTGQTTTPETVKDANGKTTQVATTKAGNIEWNHDTQTMDEVVQKYITLNKGDKYATSDDMVGTWHWISGVANEITLKPTSNNPEDLVLVYEKNKGESGPSTDYDLPKLDYGQSGPSTDYDLPKLDYGQSGPSTDYDLPKLDYGQSGPSTDYDLPKLDYGQSGPSTDYDLPKLDYGQSGPSTDYDLPKLDYGQSGPSTDYDLPKLDYGQSGPSTDYDLPKLDYGQSGPSTDYDLPKLNYGQSGPSTDYDLPKLDYGQSGPSTDYDLPKLDYGQSGPELNYDLPKAEIPSQPTEQPTEQPTSQPTVQPTEQPTSQPTAQPTEQPTSQPTAQPTEQPTSQPTAQPTEQPTSQPTAQPTEQPTSQPTVQPTEQPTSQPTAQPTEQPTSQPTAQPTEQPTSQPTAQPTEQPTSQPTAQPIEQPTSQPTAQPTEQPTSQPTAQPTEQPTSQPTVQPTEQPTSQPTAQPTEQPSEQKNEEPQPMITQVSAKKGETSIIESTNSSSTQPTTKQGTQQLPQTGSQKSSSLIGLGFAGLLSALGLTKVNKKRKD